MLAKIADFIDRFVMALNKINNNVMVMFIFALGVASAGLAFLMIAHHPDVDHDISKGFAGLGLVLVSGAMMAFRGTSDSSKSQTNADGTVSTSQSNQSPPPAPPPAAIPAPKPLEVPQ